MITHGRVGATHGRNASPHLSLDASQTRTPRHVEHECSIKCPGSLEFDTRTSTVSPASLFSILRKDSGCGEITRHDIKKARCRTHTNFFSEVVSFWTMGKVYLLLCCPGKVRGKAKNAKTAKSTIQTVLASKFSHTLIRRGALGIRASKKNRERTRCSRYTAMRKRTSRLNQPLPL